MAYVLYNLKYVLYYGYMFMHEYFSTWGFATTTV